MRPGLGVGRWLGLVALVVAPLAAMPTLGQEAAGGEDETRGAASDERPPAATVSEAITVEGIRADADLPVTEKTLDREAIEAVSHGQDVPALLQATPSMTWYSDSGLGSNYSYFSLRGIQQTRINITFDGAPLNDPAEHALYFTNFHDFTSVVDSVQIQRGVGTSSVGAPSYGGSVNFASRLPAAERGGDVRVIAGSHDTLRTSVGFESGLLGNGVSFSARVSAADTDGYRERSGTRHRTLFFNAAWRGERSALRFVSFSGDVESQLAFLAVEPEILARNRRFNPLAAEERDDFGQDFAQLKYSRTVGDDTLLTASLYYNGASGWFRLWDDPVAQNDLLQFGIDQGFVGSMVTLSHEAGRLSTTVGLHLNDFSGDHTLDIGGQRIYTNTGDKETASAFAKFEYRRDSWLLFGDLQARRPEFSYAGALDLGPIDWSFLDLKVGARRRLSDRVSLYASLGRAQREPTRLDLLQGEDDATIVHDFEAVRPEEVLDFELGLDFVTPTLALALNLYAMEFSDEIALTGELSDIGLPLRRNVPESYRRGLEVDLRWQASPSWALFHSANWSRNRISEWTQFFDVYDATGNFVDSRPITYRDVPPLLTPEAVINLGAEWARGPGAVRVLGRWVDTAQLDNTGLAELRLPAYTNVDLRATLELGRWIPGAAPRLVLSVQNLFDRDDQFGSGYSYQFLNLDGAGGESRAGIPYYYPMATRSALLALEVDF